MERVNDYNYTKNVAELEITKDYYLKRETKC